MNAKKRFLSVCPKCGSTDLAIGNIIEPSQSYSIHGVGTAVFNENTCRECDYTGVCPEVEESQIPQFRKEIRKFQKNKE